MEYRLQDMTWIEAEHALRAPDCLVLVPLGAGAKQHGPHLRLDNDARMAEYFAHRVAQVREVVVAPMVTFNYYPAFTDYPGSIHLRLDTARDLIVDLCGSLAAHGARRFYVLNTGVSTLRPLKAAADELARAGVLLRYTDVLQVGGERARSVEQQAGGTHADEIETSMMLYIDPARVDMSKAVCDFHPGQGPLTRRADGGGVFSASGVYGDATLATREKGAVVVEAMIEGMLLDIDQLRALPLSAFGIT